MIRLERVCSGGLPDFLNHNTTNLQLNIKRRNSSGTTTHPKKPSVTPDPPPNSTPQQTKPNPCSNSNALDTGLLLQKKRPPSSCMRVMTARSSQASNPRTAASVRPAAAAGALPPSPQRVAHRARRCGVRRAEYAADTAGWQCEDADCEQDVAWGATASMMIRREATKRQMIQQQNSPS